MGIKVMKIGKTKSDDKIDTARLAKRKTGIIKWHVVDSLFSSCLVSTFQWYTAKNTVISPDFLVWKFCGKAQFPHSF